MPKSIYKKAFFRRQHALAFICRKSKTFLSAQINLDLLLFEELFVYLFVCLFICLFVCLLVCSFVHSCAHLFVTSTIYCGRRLNESLSCFFARRETEKRFEEKNKEIVTKFFCFVYPVYLPLFLCIFHCRKVSVEDAFILFLRFIPKICF